MKYVVTTDGREYEIEIRDEGDQPTIVVDGKVMESTIIAESNQHHFLMLLDSMSYDAEVFRNNDEVRVCLHGREFDCVVEDQRLVAIRRAAGLRSDTGKKDLHAPMPGLVMRLLKAVGDRVKKGDPLLVVEAMKMENELKSPADGIIENIYAVVGKPVDKGAVLVTFSE